MARAKTTKKTRRKATSKGTAPKRRRTRRGGKPTQLAFEALAIEGGLLSPDWLARAAQLEAGGQSEADYRIPKGLNLRDEIGRYWRIAQALWSDLSSGREAAASDEAQLGALAERFVTTLLRDCFGFASIGKVEPAELDERLYPIGHAALEGRVPVVIAPAGMGLDALSPSFGDGTRRRSAFGLCQEFLNAEDGALWGLASDGERLRILRDNASLTRPAWIEADLGRIFTEERYADFAALWLLAHETRFGRPGQPVTECSLEAWREAGREEGTRAREQLRHGVEEALAALGQGFLAHADNQSLRTVLSSGALTKEAYFQELLRLAYRLIFLLTVEERGVLHPDAGEGESTEAARKLYAEGYGLRRLRERAVKRSAHDRHHDHWETVKIVFGGLADGESRLALPALAGIFAKDQCPTLDEARLENRFLLLALFRLSWLREDAGLARVNWRDMGPEELGSVYESLLELVPQITEGGRAFSFATGAETKGHARKTTGSYYTPDSLVQVLLDSALEPVVEQTIAEHPSDAVDALLSLSVVDPACGSGHFLLAAARRLAAHVARLQADGTPSAAEYRHALRQVVGRCIYGVDLNPMAVELCKVSLWMEAVEPGLPLTFLDSHIRHGNALLGTTPELMEKGIPDDAWKPIEGDDKKVASALKKRNKDSAQGQRGLDTLWSKPKADEADELREAIAALESAPDVDAAALAAKESRWQELLDSKAYQHQKLVADAWCAAFVWPKQPGPLAEAAPTNELWRQIRDGQGHPPELTVKTVNELAEQYTFFHWHLAFPQVFGRGGFDVVLGNPPFVNAIKRVAESATSSLARYLALPLGGTADLAYRFLACAISQIRPTGRVGFVQPRGLLNAAPVRAFRQAIVGGEAVVDALWVPPRADFFAGASVFICIVVFRRSGPSASRVAVTTSPPTQSEWCAGELKTDNWWRDVTLLSGTTAIDDDAGLSTAWSAVLLGELYRVQASMTAGDAYDLVPFVVDDRDGSGPKLVTTGLIEPNECLWGDTTCRYLKVDYLFPRIAQSAGLPKSLAARIERARRPKVIVAGLSKRVECFLDGAGVFIGAVSTYSIFDCDDDVGRLERLTRFLLSDHVTAQFRLELGANAMGGGNATMKKGFLKDLRLPTFVIDTAGSAMAADSEVSPVGEDEWARPRVYERGEIQAAILAVLKAHGAPMDRREARLAALLCLEPHLLISLTDDAEKSHWIRVVGGDAGKSPSASIDATAQEWGAALTGLRGRGRLIEDLQQNTWEVGAGADAIDTSGWPEGRASFVVNVLRRLQESTQVDAIVLRLPTNVQQWLANAA